MHRRNGFKVKKYSGWEQKVAPSLFKREEREVYELWFTD